jgi:eukaryotic-like serine/threonine-protein kinase
MRQVGELSGSSPPTVGGRRIEEVMLKSELDDLHPLIRSSGIMSDDQSPRAMAERRVGQTLNDKWRIDRVIDLGGMGAVFAATHRNGKRVAIKMLHPHIAADEGIRQRFLREGYVANRVEHRGAVQVLDDDKAADGAVFLVMELLEGDSLERLMARVPAHRIPVHEVLGVADQVLDTLAAFHAEGVIHRDIKPANLFITREGVVKVLDFGLARLREPDVGGVPLTGAGIVLGTVSYMPPEQALGRSDAIDARSDIFALGAVMFHAMSGSVFLKGETALERLMNAGKTPAPKLATHVPGIPSYVAELVDTSLAYDKAHRWADARSMRAAVRAAYRTLVSDAERRSAAPAPSPAIRPNLPAARDDSIRVEEGSLEFGPSVVHEISTFDVMAPASPALPHAPRRVDERSPTRAAIDPTESEAIYREALQPSIVVEVSFADEAVPNASADGGRRP